MNFRPCIDIHNGKVKQIVGSTLKDGNEGPLENFVAENDPDYFASLYKKDGLKGGHIILLNKAGTPEYAETKREAFKALKAYEGGMQIGGGINAANAGEFLEAGASHVIVTSFVFKEGKIDYDALKAVSKVTEKRGLVLDLSCKKVGDAYHIATDRWQNISDEIIDYRLFDNLAEYCDEFLIHAADVEGKKGGIDASLASLLGGYDGIKITYAGGIAEYSHIDELRELGRGRLDFTIGSALDLFGGKLSYNKIVNEIVK